MLFSDTYTTIANPSSGEFKDKGSKFIGFAFPVQSEEHVKTHLQQLKKEHFSAAHHCYAFVLGSARQVQKSNDDREPSNTAGRSILRAILSKELTNTLVIVVRYFGGKLLGVPGLINAYGQAATEALNGATVIEKIITEQHRLTFAYEHENEAFRLIKQFGLNVLQHHHSEEVALVFEVRTSMAPTVLEAIKGKRVFKTEFLKEVI